jgi:hypothetical protein
MNKTPETDAFAKAMYSRGVDSHHDGREALKHAKRLERERDEARELLASEKITRNHIIQRGIEMQKERDEAREALREIWQSGDAFLPYVDEETTNRWRKAAGWEETK